MGQYGSREIRVEKYISPPYITKEDVYQIKNCFEYLNPKDGILEISRMSKEFPSFPEYMHDVIDEMKAMNTDITFDDFFSIMKPKLLALKQSEGSVVMENTSASVFCVLCPYKNTQEKSFNNPDNIIN